MWFRGKCSVGEAAGHILHVAIRELMEHADGDGNVYVEVENDGSYCIEKTEKEST